MSFFRRGERVVNLADVCIVTLVPPCLFLPCIMAARFDSRLNFESSCKTQVCFILGVLLHSHIRSAGSLRS